jgi:hypothetical protein
MLLQFDKNYFTGRLLMTDNLISPLLLKLEFTIEGTHIALNKETIGIASNSEKREYSQALSALSLLNIFVDDKRFEEEMKKFAKTFDIEKLERNLALLEEKSSIH